ncbi:hypothetical protein BDP27DRAFT_1366754 [Rhodocollybia butyracea]|uniref:F-box domain-containing protein n=1 Tax=Rhodocollybia butyracea TaxID=206335 RepID=A0A9P5U3W8_9AGAR|nr:hypothetical protein BDP27DRAFT_1366754 [Rhodocollybia butyracea]
MSSLILALPIELQTEIFRALHASEKGLGLGQDEIRKVSYVCSLWRQLTLSTSAFWTFIYVTKDSVDLNSQFPHPCMKYNDAEPVFPWVAEVLRRSGHQPLDIFIKLHYDSFNPAVPETVNMLTFPWHLGHPFVLSRLLAGHTARFRSVDIISELWYPLQALPSFLVGHPMPLLEAWNVTRDNPQFGHHTVSDLPLEAEMPILEAPVSTLLCDELAESIFPKLRVLTIHGVPQRWGLLIPRNLLALDLSHLPRTCRPTYAAFKALLLGSQSTLQQLTLWASAPEPLAGYDHGTITLPNLHFISLGMTLADATSSLVTFLDVPSLQRLEIHDLDHGRPGYQSRLEFSSLASLVLNILGQWPLRNLTHLTLGGLSFPTPVGAFKDTDDALTEQREPHCPPIPFTFLFACPSLRYLHLVNPDACTLRALVSPLFLKDAGQAALLPCWALECLHIETSMLRDLLAFFRLDSQWCESASKPDPIVAPRFFPTILLDVPPEWGNDILTYASRKTAGNIKSGVLYSTGSHPSRH